MVAQADLSTLLLSDGEMTLRPATAADEAQLFIWLTDPEVYRWWGGGPAGAAQVRQYCSVQRDDDGIAWPFIVLRGDEAIGYLQVWRDRNGESGLDMFLAPLFRGRGFGARAAQAMARYLSDAGWQRLTADPAVGNLSAIRMWEKAGFAKTGEVIDIGDGPSALMVFRKGGASGKPPPWI
jgi:RimJ/RimL family protein N-acetyltransferase